MKNLFLIFSVVCSTMFMQAQDSTSSVWDHHATFGKPMWIGGSLGFQSISEVSSSFSIGPQWGMMINNRFGAGINIDYIHTSYDDTNTNEADNTWNIHPYVRLYFAGTKNFKLYGDAFIEFGGGTSTFRDNTADAKFSTFGLGLDLGAQFWFADDFSMAFGIEGISYSTNKPNGGDSQGTLTLGLKFTELNYSLFYHF